MRKTDFILHNLLFALLILILLIQGKEGLVFVLIAQFLVGIYQLFSTAIRTLHFRTFNKQTQLLIKIYWFTSTLYLIGLIIMFYSVPDSTITYSYLFSAWGIALYYHFITYKLAYPKFTKSHLDI
jgi:hypothetical protein